MRFWLYWKFWDQENYKRSIEAYFAEYLIAYNPQSVNYIRMNMHLENRKKKRLEVCFPLLILLAGLLSYFNSLYGQFIFDDKLVVENNNWIRHIFLFKPSIRYITDITFAFNYAIGKLNPVDYHATNIVIHLVAGLFLYGIIRRTLLLHRINDRLKAHASVLAFFSSTLWVVHPLTTSAVSYISQRYESLMTAFYLATLYSVVRGSISVTHRKHWYIMAFSACAFGMASKEVMITAPIIILLYDRIFFEKSIKDVFYKRKWLYVSFAVCWIILVLLMIFGATQSDVTGIVFSSAEKVSNTVPITMVVLSYLKHAIYYFFTQSIVILHYLKLSFWPHRLCLDYAWPIVNELSEALPSLLFLISIIIFSLFALWKYPAIGFLSISFFVILSPTSSFLPRPDLAFEHRMYLPLTLVITGAVLLWYVLLCCINDFLVVRIQSKNKRWNNAFFSFSMCVVILLLGIRTYVRNKDYYSKESMWRSVVKIRPDNAMAKCGLISGLLSNGKYKEAESIAALLLKKVNNSKKTESSVRSVPESSVEYFYFQANNFLGQALLCQGRSDEALYYISEALKIKPENEFAHNCKGVALLQQGKPEEAMHEFIAAVRINPKYGKAHANLATILEQKGDYHGAVKHYLTAVKLKETFVVEKLRLAWLLSACPDDSVRNGVLALDLAIQVARETNNNPNVLDVLASAYAEVGRFEDAVKCLQKAVNILSGVSQTTLKKEILKRLELYKKKYPYRMEDKNLL